jgi:hypothetical protein
MAAPLPTLKDCGIVAAVRRHGAVAGPQISAEASLRRVLVRTES